MDPRPVKIERIEVVALQIPLEKSFSGSSYRIEKKMAIVRRAQLIASFAHGTCMETHHPLRDPLFHKLADNRNLFVQGRYRVPDEPGWGVRLDAELVGRYRVN